MTPVSRIVPPGVSDGLPVLGQVGAGSFAAVSTATPLLNEKSGRQGTDPAHCAGTSGRIIFGPLPNAAPASPASTRHAITRRLRIASSFRSGDDAERLPVTRRAQERSRLRGSARSLGPDHDPESRVIRHGVGGRRPHVRVALPVTAGADELPRRAAVAREKKLAEPEPPLHPAAPGHLWPLSR